MIFKINKDVIINIKELWRLHVNITILVSDIYKTGGVQRVVSILANYLTKKSLYKITILSLFKTAEKPYFDLNPKISTKNIFEQPFNLKLHFLKVVKGIKRNLKNNDTDLIIFAGMGLGLFVKMGTFKNNSIKLIGWEHQQFYFGKKFGLEWIGKRIACYYMDATVVLTKEDYQQYKSGLKRINKLVQIYNPAEITYESMTYKKNTKKIMSVGSLVSQKGFDYAIEVAKLVFEKFPDWQWHIYGDGPDRLKLEEKIKLYKLEKNIIIMGYYENVYDKYRNYSFYVMTSRHEGFPMVLIEAKVNKLPIVSFDCKFGPNELIKNEVNGYLISNFDTYEMSLKIIELISNKDKLEFFSENAYKDLEKLNIELIIGQWENLINNIYLGE